jgi:hypothetical protein
MQVQHRLAAQLRASAPGAKKCRANALPSSDIDSNWRDCGSWRGRGGASFCGRQFRGFDRCGERQSFIDSGEGRAAQSFKRPWL